MTQNGIIEHCRSRKGKAIAAVIVGGALGAYSFSYIVRNTDLVGIRGATVVAAMLGTHLGAKAAASFYEDYSNRKRQS